MNTASAGVNIAANILGKLETSSSAGMFVRDTGGCLISRLGLSRSKDESKEISFAELSESVLFYFSAPALAHGSTKFFAKQKNITKDRLLAPMSELCKISDKTTLKNIKLAKFARTGTVFSVILPAVFGIAPLRNLMSLASSGKKDFTSLIGLENKNEQKEKKQAQNKAAKLLKSLGISTIAGLGATFGLLFAAKNKNFYKKAEPYLDKFLKHLDFTKDCDLKLAHYGALIYPASIAGYFYASRDKYERMENARRFSITVPLMFFGEKLIQNPIYKKFDKIYKTDVFNGGNIRTYKEISRLPENMQKQMLKSKNAAYSLTFAINTMAIAAAVALLNRAATRLEFNRDKALVNNNTK